jgi:dolichol-phosphate mannosyltransferase
MSDALVIIPTYNEIDNVERMARTVMAFEKDFHILFVDDNSPDGTADKIKALQQELQQLGAV